MPAHSCAAYWQNVMVHTRNAKLVQLSSTPWAPGTEIRLRWLTWVSVKCHMMKFPFYSLGNFRADVLWDTWKDIHMDSAPLCQTWDSRWTRSGCCQCNGWIWGTLQQHHLSGHSLESCPALGATGFASWLRICRSSESSWLQLKSQELGVRYRACQFCEEFWITGTFKVGCHISDTFYLNISLFSCPRR